MKRLRSYSFFLAMALALLTTAIASCTRGIVYSHFEPIPEEGWERANVLHFDIGPMADSCACEERLNLRATSFYPYTELVLIVDQLARLSGVRCTDTITLKMVDDHGQSLGSGISSQQFTLPLRQLNLKADDILHVQVRHNMHHDPLPGVLDVGIEVKSEE